MLLRYALCSLCLLYSVESIIIDTSYGKLEGYQTTTNNGAVVNIFKSVPFASPPINELRWKKPILPKKWTAVRRAKEYSAACMSNSSITSSPQKWVDEDCLYLNIYTSQNCLESKNCPVVFYIHGGGFNYDSAVMFKDEYLVNNFGSRDVVLVVAAFRLGFTALLTLDNDDIVPRNLAIYDIIAGLQFVQNEIVTFGGDPRRVTLFGHSMGGSVTAMLTFSKSINNNKALFERTVSMSPMIEFAPEMKLRITTEDFIYRAGCSKFPRMLAGDKKAQEESIICLRKKSGLELLRIQREMEDENVLNDFSGIMMLDPLFPAKDIRDFMQNPPVTDIVFGTISKELDNKRDPNPIALQFGFENPDALNLKYMKDLHDGKLDFDHSLETQAFFFGCWTYGHNMRKAGGKVFLYSFDYPKHPYHTDDLFYIMGIHPFEMDENEKVIAQVYPDLLLNFTKYGEPSKEWTPLQKDVDNYMSINVNKTTGETSHMKEHYQKEVIDYWSKTMVVFDQLISNMKQHDGKKFVSTLRDVTLCDEKALLARYQLENSFSYSFFAFLSVLIFLGGVITGKYLTRTEYESLEKFSEKTPLLKSVF